MNKLQEIRELEIELGFDYFKFSDDLQLENRLKSLLHIKQLRKDAQTRKNYFDKPLFGFCKKKKYSEYEDDEEDIYGLYQIQNNQYQELNEGVDLEAGGQVTHQ